MRLPDGYRVRYATLEDVPAIAALGNAYGQALLGEDLISVDELRAQLSLPGFDRELSTRWVTAPDGRGAAFSAVFNLRDPYVRIFSWNMVLPEFQGLGLGTALFDWLRAEALRTLDKAPDGARVVLQQSALDGDSAAIAFMISHGFLQTRHFWRMAIDLTGAGQRPGWPTGVHVGPIDIDADLETVLRAMNDAFRDHYGHVEGAIEQRLDMARHEIETDPNHDPDLLFAAWDDERVVGACFAQPTCGTDANTGYIGTLGVVPGARRRGIGQALLLEAFDRLRAKGKTAAKLHVDSQSLTGATRLYERVGMHIDRLSHEFTLELRPGTDLLTR